jgi:hypothetical protein
MAQALTRVFEAVEHVSTAAAGVSGSTRQKDCHTGSRQTFGAAHSDSEALSLAHFSPSA